MTEKCVSALFLLLSALLCVRPARGDWDKTITCADGDTYRDLPIDAGREQFCERLLPGSLVVKDGPYRSWFSEGHPSAVGSYLLGREVGIWTECSRFDCCQQVKHEAVSAEERSRTGFSSSIPVSFENGRYVFDFASCRGTWITQINLPDPVSLNIGGSRYRCEVAWLPASVTTAGGPGDYVCFIPYSVGRRSFASIDLMREFPKAGLPQFCRAPGSIADPLMIREKAWEVASSESVQCATIKRAADGSTRLTIRLDSFTTRLVAEAAVKEGPLNTLLCFDSIAGPSFDPKDSAFTFKLSESAAARRKQEACVESRLHVPRCDP